jgi:hypothetical protein
MSVDLKEQLVIDESGNRVAVLIDIEKYQKVLEGLEEFEANAAYESKSSNDETVTFDQAIREIENQR